MWHMQQCLFVCASCPEHGFHTSSISWIMLDYGVFLYCCVFLWGPGCVQCDVHVCHGGAHHVLLSVCVPQAVPWLPEGTCISHFVCMNWFGKSYLQSGLESFTDWVCWGEGAGGLVVNQTGSQRTRTAKENTRARSDPSEIFWSKLCPTCLVICWLFFERGPFWQISVSLEKSSTNTDCWSQLLVDVW